MGSLIREQAEFLDKLGVKRYLKKKPLFIKRSPPKLPFYGTLWGILRDGDHYDTGDKHQLKHSWVKTRIGPGWESGSREFE